FVGQQPILTVPASINAQGVIVGYRQSTPATFGVDGEFPFFYDTASTGDRLVVLNSTGQFTGINDQGIAVGFFDTPNGWTAGGVIFQNGSLTLLHVPGANNSEILTGINNRGDITGYYDVPSSNGHFFRGYHGFLYHAGRFTKLDYPGAFATYPLAVND